jgi:hypothetical protein
MKFNFLMTSLKGGMGGGGALYKSTFRSSSRPGARSSVPGNDAENCAKICFMP